MKLGIVFVGAGLAALVMQGALATLIPPPWCPDLVLLVLVGIGLRWERAPRGLVLAALIGYATDLLSGSLLGQYALRDLAVFGGTMLATRQLNLRGALPLSFFAASLTLVCGVAMLAITGFFVGGVEVRVRWLSAQLIHAMVAGAFAPFVSAAVGRLFDRFGDQEAGQMPMTVGRTG